MVLWVVSVVVVVTWSELDVEVKTVIEVDVTVPLTVVVIVSVSIGFLRAGCVATEGEIESTAEMKMRTPRATPSILYARNCEPLFSCNAHFFLIRLMTPTEIRPNMIPARIDSHGKPGIPGI